MRFFQIIQNTLLLDLMNNYKEINEQNIIGLIIKNNITIIWTTIELPEVYGRYIKRRCFLFHIPDTRLKKDIKPIEDSSIKLLSISRVNYKLDPKFNLIHEYNDKDDV